MAVGLASLVLVVILCAFVIGYSSTVLAYAGNINQKGSADAKSNMPKARVSLLWISGILLILAVVIPIVAGVQYGKANASPGFTEMVSRL